MRSVLWFATMSIVAIAANGYAQEPNKEPAKAECAEIMELCRELGLLIGKGGLQGQTIRIKPPLCLTLADADFRLGVDRVKARLLLGEGVAVLAPHLRQGGPPLPVPADVLPLVLADRAPRRRLGALRELAPAGDAGEVRQSGA